jgi:hypothetical protein
MQRIINKADLERALQTQRHGERFMRRTWRRWGHASARASWAVA